MIKGFREFILRGNVIDLAVAVVIGAAFTAIVNVIVSGFITPFIGLVFQTGNLNDLVVSVPTLFGGVSEFAIGSIIEAIINFLIVALVVYFVFVYPMNRAKAALEARKGVQSADEGPSLPTEQELLVQIRDLLASQPGRGTPAP
jgi:large conductance mechanosensitive channel